MENEKKNIFTISIMNKWYVIISLVLILMRIFNIVDWHPLILIAPIWVPSAIAFILIAVLYIIKGLVLFIDLIYKKIKGY